jgi:nucleoside-diphosphate-sugar epimerase
MRILVCGAIGFIGRNIVESLQKVNGYKVTAVYNKRPPFLIDNVDFVQADLTVADDVERVVKSHDIVIQAAANTTGVKDCIERPYVHVTDNAVMNSLILKSCYDNHVKKFIFFSCTVMYQTKAQPFLENPVIESDFDPSNEIFPGYFGVGWTKVYIEKMCEFYSRLGRTKHYVIRHSNIYGPYDKFDLENSHVFGATVNKVLSEDSDIVSIWGDGSEERDLLYINDLVDSVEKIISTNDKSPFCLLNIGSGIAISIKDLVDKILEISGVDDKEVVFEQSKPTVKTSVSLDCSKAKLVLGWQPKVSLEDGIKKTILWYKRNKTKDTRKTDL